MTVGPEDANGSCCPNPMRMEEDHDLPHGLLLGPPRDDLRCAPRANAGNLGQALGARLDDLEGALAKGSHDALGHRRTDAAHLTGREIPLDTLHPGRWGGLQDISLELEPMGLGELL